MSIIFIIILILFLTKLLRDSLYFAWLWQVKEYRIDRMKAYLRDEKSIIYRNISYYFIALWVMTCFMHQVVFIFLTLLFFVCTFYQILIEIKSRTLKRPKFTFKVILVFFLEVIFYFSLFAFYWIPVLTGMTENLILLLLFSYIITPLLITIIILLINPFFNFQKRKIIKKATVKMRGLKKIKVIGITGSYGKTSTKEFLYTILSQKYKVVKTEGNNNTNIGVAYTVLNKVGDDYDYFICEMGAYKIGEIAEICNIVKPEIGILTGINEQHIDLFGSIENTIKAKFELIESLPKNGTAIINSRIKNPSNSAGRQESRIKNNNIKYFSIDSAENIKVHQSCAEFDYLTTPSPSFAKEESIKCKLNLLGKHYIENVLSAIMTAEYLGMSLDEIKNAVEKIKPAEFMMRKLSGPNDSIFIDDSYSANPDGVIAALNYLNEAYKDYKKIIVFPGIIELGKESDDVHKKLFSKIDEVCDTAYILKNAQKLHSPAETMEPTKFIFEKDFGKVADLLKNNLDEKTVVLFESRGAGVVMGKLFGCKKREE